MKLNYCLECAAPLTKVTDTQYICTNDHEFWNNPRATADVVLVNREGKILFSKRAREPNKGGYDLPGGFVEYGESAQDAAIREIKEETGISLTPDTVELIFSCPGFYLENESLVTNIFLVREWEGEPVAADDSEALEWKPLDFLDSEAVGSVYDGLRAVLEGKL
jgi:mutator protein MutT